jgi:thioredoxin reductase (NADPH)
LAAGFHKTKEPIDCLIIGAGPAGLTAATYLGRFNRNTLVIDGGKSRAAQIPESHNHPGFAGIAGPALLAAMRHQAGRYGARFEHGEVTALEHSDDGYLASFERTDGRGSGEVRAERVLLATGLTDAAPDLPGLDQAVANALIRYCPICDGFEATDANLAVYGPFPDARNKALFLRTYTRRVTILWRDPGADRQDLAALGIAVAASPPARMWQSNAGIGV